MRIDQISQAQFDHVKSKFDTRVKLFRDLLQSGKPIVFFRVERDTPGLINFPEDGITEPELFYVQKFAQLMKQRNVNCKIVFFTSTNPTGWDETNKICSVHFEHDTPKQILMEKDIITVFTDNQHFIKTSLA
jgi:hypothetical protein